MRKNNWGEDRVLYYNAQGRLCSVLASWTSLALQDAFSLASAGLWEANYQSSGEGSFE